MILAMIDMHAGRFPSLRLTVRLDALGMTPSGYCRLKANVEDRSRRESVIPEGDVSQLVQFIVQNPDVGAARAAATLLDKEKAMISVGFINDARQEIKKCAEQCYRERDQREKAVEAALRARQAANRQQYSHIHAAAPHHVWAMDFVMFNFLGYRLAACEVYDVYSQGYLAIEIGLGCDSDLAVRTLSTAIAETGRRPPGTMLRRDNGSAFITDAFQSVLTAHGIADQPIPPGQPWYNGSLESGNGSLRTAVLTAAMQSSLQQPKPYSHGRLYLDKAVDLLQEACNAARKRLNEDISRTKFNMPPAQVLAGERDVTEQRHERFRAQKQKERKRRMAELRHSQTRNDNSKSFLDKVRACFQRIARQVSTDQLYIFNEVMHGRFKHVQV